MHKFFTRNFELSSTDYYHEYYSDHHLTKDLEVAQLYFADSKSSLDLNY